jgi:acyl-CoA thioester hydrolase
MAHEANKSEDFNSKLLFTANLKVGHDNLSYGHHLAADEVPKMLHEVRIMFLQKNNFTEVNIENGAGIILKEMSISYESESYLDNDLEFKLFLKSLGRHSAILFYEIFNITTNKKMATASETIVFFNYTEKKVCRTPRAFADLVENI